MKDLVIDKTSNTPLVEFSQERGILKIEGRSIPENPGDFYDILIDWIKEYFDEPLKITRFEVNLEYVNSGSSKFLLGIFRYLKEKYDEGRNIQVNWYYEEDDEAILGLGEHYKTSIKVPFNLVEII